MPRHRTKLTPKEASFIPQIIKHKGNRTLAVMDSDYDVKGKETAQNLGSELMKKPRILEAIQEALNKHGLTPDYLIEKSTDIIKKGLEPVTKDNIRYSVKDSRLMLVEILKLQNAYPDRVQKSMSLNVRKDISVNNVSEVNNLLKELNNNTSKLLKEFNK